MQKMGHKVILLEDIHTNKASEVIRRYHASTNTFGVVGGEDSARWFADNRKLAKLAWSCLFCQLFGYVSYRIFKANLRSSLDSNTHCNRYLVSLTSSYASSYYLLIDFVSNLSLELQIPMSIS